MSGLNLSGSGCDALAFCLRIECGNELWIP